MKLSVSSKCLLSLAVLVTVSFSAFSQQNITTAADGTQTLSPTEAAPAFGAVINYDDPSFLISGWSRSDYADYPQITNIPTMYLSTVEGETLDYSNKTETYYQATIVIVDKKGTMKQRSETTTFRGRGNATWNSGSYKKPWRLKFPSKTSLLAEYDMAKGKEVEPRADAKSWTLLSNPYDKSMIRNAVSNELGQLIGLPFCPAYKFVDLVLNGEYYGTYQISDHMEVAKKRVYVDSKNDWFLELCDSMYGEDPQFSTNGCHFNIKNPDDDAEVAAAMKDYMSKVISAVNAKTGLAQYVDLASLADYLMGMDVTANFDGAKGNGYSYKGLEATDKLKWGPLWDLDLGYGNVGGWASASNVDTKHFWEIQSGYNSWFFKLIYESAEFQKVFYPRWKAVYEAGLTSQLNKKVDAIYKEVKASALLNYTKGGHTVNQWNYEKWNMGVSNMGLTYTNSNNASVVATDYAKACQDIKDFNTTHIAWLNEHYRADYESITGLKAESATEPTTDPDEVLTPDEPSTDEPSTDEPSSDQPSTSVTYSTTLGEWQYVQIPASAFSSQATSATLVITGACYARYMTGANWNYTNIPGGEFGWNNDNKSGMTYVISGDILAAAIQGNLCVNAGGGNPITLTVTSTTGSGSTEEPSIEEPEEPSTDEPEEPSTEEPEEPSTEEPEEPSTEEPEEPSTDEPEEPSTEEPEEPSIEEPEEPNTDEPEEPSTDEPEEPSTDEPSGDSSDTHTYAATINGYFNIPAADLTQSAAINVSIQGTDGTNYIWVKYAVNGATAQWYSGVYYAIQYAWGVTYGEFTIDDSEQIRQALQNGINIICGFKTADITVTCSSSAHASGRDTSGIEEVTDTPSASMTYDINGRRSHSNTGLLLRQGQKVIIK